MEDTPRRGFVSLERMAERPRGSRGEVNETTLIYLIRHGDAVPSLDVTLDDGQHYDLMDLSAKGRAQAEALAVRLTAHAKIAALYSSPTPRAYQTGEPLARALGLPIERDDAFREVQMQGASLDEYPPHERAAAMRDHLELMARTAMREGSWASIPGAEPSAELRSRVTVAVESLVARHSGSSVAIFSHAGTINAYLAQLLGVARDFFFPAANTSVSIVRALRDYRIVERINDVAHLEDAGLFVPSGGR